MFCWPYCCVCSNVYTYYAHRAQRLSSAENTIDHILHAGGMCVFVVEHLSTRNIIAEYALR